MGTNRDASKTLTQLGEVLEDHRRRAGLSKSQVTRSMSSARSTWDRMISGNHRPGVELVLKAARAVSLDPAEALRLAGFDPDLVSRTRGAAGFQLAS